MNFGDLNLKNEYGGMKAYKQSKLANILFSNHLRKLLNGSGSGIAVTSISPGFVKTQIARDYIKSWWKGILAVLITPFLICPYKGCKTILYTSLHKDIQHNCKKFYRHSKEQKLSCHALNEEDAATLWEISEKLTGVKSSEYL